MNSSPRKIFGTLRNFLLPVLPRSWMTIRGNNPDSIYLTFDDGPNPRVTPQLLELLKTANAKATFFLVGTNMKAYPDLVRQIVADGHAIGNHSYDHQQFHQLAVERQLDQVISTNELIKQITGLDCKIFRAPGGRLSFGLFLKLIKLGITSVHWSKDSLDSKHDCERAISCLAEKPIKDKDIVLLHDDDKKVLGITEYILANYQNQRFERI